MSSATITHVQQPIAPALSAYLMRTFALDVRALAVLRIGMALVLLYDLVVRASSLTAHYTDKGVLPRSARMALEWDFCEPWWNSLHMLSGAWWWQAMLFAGAMVAALAMLVGYQTRLAIVVSWALLVSLHGRFPLLLQGGDVLLRLMLFWSMFLPLDRCCAFSSVRRERSLTITSLGTTAFIVQLAVMYLFTAMLKTDATWRAEFSATHYALAIDHFTRPLGYSLMQYPRLLQFLTAAALLLEWIGPLLLLAPMGQKWIRSAVPLSFIGFHLGLAATMDLGTFPWICIVAWITLLPSEVWNLAAIFGRTKLLESDRRSWYGSTSSNAIAAFFLLFVVLLNVNRLNNPVATVGRPPLSTLGKALGLEQLWNMFSPGPYKFGGWLRVEGETADGRLVNLYAPDEPLPDAKPTNVSAGYATQYWRRSMVTLYEFQEPAHLDGSLRYFAREWNSTHAEHERIVQARLVHMVTPTPAPFSNEEFEPERKILSELPMEGTTKSPRHEGRGE